MVEVRVRRLNGVEGSFLELMLKEFRRLTDVFCRYFRNIEKLGNLFSIGKYKESIG